MAMGFLALILFGMIWLAMAAGMLILTGFGLYRMALHAGIPSPWMAFVPVANLYVTGLLAERSYFTYNRRVRRLARWSVVSAFFPVVGALLLFLIPFSRFVGFRPGMENTAILSLSLVCTIPALLSAFLYVYCLYYIFRDYAPDNAMLYTIISLLFNIGFVFLLVERDTVPVSVTGFGFYPYGRPKYDRWHQWRRTPPQSYGGPPPDGPNTTGPEDYHRNR